MKLQRRLSLTMALLLVLGLLIADVATYTSLRSFLVGRLDEQLSVAQRQAYDDLVYLAARGRVVTAAHLESHVSPDAYVLLLAKDGRTLIDLPSGSPSNPDPRPALASPLRAQPALRARIYGRHQGAYRPSPYSFEAPAVGGRQDRYRVDAVAVPQGTLVTAISLSPTTDTLDSLLKIELASSIAVVLALVVLGLWTVRRGLRPLDEMTRTADAIASGELGRRVPAGDADTEVGRLGGALNAMLAQIETAFDEKSISEARLRQFVADASHELRTPLTSIRGYAELLRNGGFPDEESRHRALSRVEHEAARMGDLVDDLLLLARLDQGRALREEPVDLAVVAHDVIEDARAVDPERPLTMQGSGPVVVVGDPDRLGQAAHNLVRNALVHTPPGTPVRVKVATDGAMGTIRVSDSGPGLRPGEAVQVFDRFYRGDLARPRGGTGLGLSIVRAIAEALHGSASVETVPGGGTAFTVAIPLLDRGDRHPPALLAEGLARQAGPEQLAVGPRDERVHHR